ncbi:endonuclease NucS [Hyphomicrobiales bacterium]|jgi:hypothetical protein|nr:endonuclease NucS [Hyphomicrobiales bacterium]
MNSNFLDDFIKQSQTNNLKTKDLYPENLFDLKVKVSFGMGTPAARPWVSILGPGMSTSNGYYPVFLYHKKDNILDLCYGRSETSSYPHPWSIGVEKKFSNLPPSKDRDSSWIFKSYKPKIIENEVKYYSDDREISSVELLSHLSSIVNEYKTCLDIELKDESSDISKGLFYMEHQLEDFIIDNWNETQFGKKYNLIEEDGVLKSQQFRTDIGPIDILAKDKETDDYVVIELKRNQTSDDTVGQISRYMGWVQENLHNDTVKGVIVCGKYDEKLFYAQKIIPNIEIFLYELNFSLKEYKK